MSDFPFATKAPSSNKRAARLRLLVVEDDTTHASLIARAAKQSGHAVTAARSIRDALLIVRTNVFDCITLDLTLRDGSGMEVLSALAEINYMGTIIIVSGAKADQRTAARLHARGLGVEIRSLPKPLDFSALRVCLADIATRAMGLPAAHMWGGMQVDMEYERHRGCHR